ncbi:MAG: plasmid pRiA4b ORF-3 family protein [Solirubrobacteraceae bacterium]|nr:plasmid pRiA4b ORF-3 family protein [Solirubrobacteraceae bacterium]
MTQQTYVFKAELVGFQEVRRTITVRGDVTLVDLHYALQSAFGWDDDHLYSFWLDGAFWGPEDSHYMHPYHAISLDPPGRSACVPLDELRLSERQRIAYLFDFAAEWRVALTLQEIRALDGRAATRCIESVGAAPPQYAQALG